VIVLKNNIKFYIKIAPTFQIDHQPDVTIPQFIILTFIYSSICFGRSPAHHQELNDSNSSLWFYLRIVVTAVLCSWPARPRKQHSCHHDTKVKPEAATAVIKLLMISGRTPETCWTVNKLQDNKLRNSCIWLVIYLNCTMMQEITNLKKKAPTCFCAGTPSSVSSLFVLAKVTLC